MNSVPPDPPPPPSDGELKSVPGFDRLIPKWTLVCSIAAGPSFVMGFELAMHQQPAAAIIGMILGVIAFIAIYVIAERTRRVRRIMSKRHAVRTAWIGYGTRSFISIVFPLGLSIDIFCGLFSWGFVAAVRGNEMGFAPHQSNVASPLVVFVQFFATTIVQGVLLNFVLIGYMLVVFGICGAWSALQKPVYQSDSTSQFELKKSGSEQSGEKPDR